MVETKNRPWKAHSGHDSYGSNLGTHVQKNLPSD